MATFNYFRYTRNDGVTNYAVKVRSDVAGVGGLGWGAASAADPPRPAGFRLRKIYSRDPTTGRRRADPVATPAAFAALLAGGQNILLEDVGIAGTVQFNVEGGREEGFRRGAPHLIH